MSKITHAPLPEWRVLIKSIGPNSLDAKEMAKPWLLNDSDIPYWFSRSAFSMLAIARWYEVCTNGKFPSIWVPDYLCNEALQLLREAGYPLVFYPITGELIPDWEVCQAKAATSKPDIFIMVHYFGRSSGGKQARQFCDEHECILVEDAAHVLIPHHEIGLSGEFIFYSPHKLLAVPDGALLIQRSNTKLLLKLSNNQPTEVMAQIMETMPRESPAPWIWLFKRFLQKVLPDFLWLKKDMAEVNIDSCSKGIPFKPRQSQFGRRLLVAQLVYLNEYAHARQKNDAIIKSFIESTQEKAVFPDDDYAPYMTGIACEAKEYAEQRFRLLKGKRAPVMKWPDLAPEVLAHPEKHSTALEMEKPLLFLPVHQSLQISAMKRMGRLLGVRSHKDPEAENYTLEWQHGQEEWAVWTSEAGKSNLMQSWEYGDVKERVEGWKVKRGLIKNSGRVVAIFQALEKSWGLFGVIRINRGPLLIGEVCDFNTKYNIYKTLRKGWSWWQGRILLIAPELLDTPGNVGALALAGFRKRQGLPWKSSHIYLSLSEVELRKNLDGKWRNQLKRAEQASIDLKIGKTDELFSWLMNQYKQLMKDKSFKGPSVDLYKDLHRAKKKDMHVFQAWFEGKAVAGLLIVQHGRSCTYQVGWNSQTGRKIYANNLLLWKAVIDMKKRGCTWFDLGGIDEQNTPGIAKFKRGLRGEEYTSVGEWVTSTY